MKKINEMLNVCRIDVCFEKSLMEIFFETSNGHITKVFLLVQKSFLKPQNICYPEPHLGREEAPIHESVTDNVRIVLYVYFPHLALSVVLWLLIAKLFVVFCYQNKNILAFPDENKTLTSKNFLLMPFLTKEAIW